MNKVSEEKSRPIITLSLPLIEIGNTSLFNIDNYKESGVFLVKASDGSCAILDINIKDHLIAGEFLPINVINRIVEQQTEISLKENFEKRLSELTEEIKGHLHHFEDALNSSARKNGRRIGISFRGDYRKARKAGREN